MILMYHTETNFNFNVIFASKSLKAQMPSVHCPLLAEGFITVKDLQTWSLLHVGSSFILLLNDFVSHVFQEVDQWSFDVFAFHEATTEHALKFLVYDLLTRYDLINRFRVHKLSLSTAAWTSGRRTDLCWEWTETTQFSLTQDIKINN